MLKRLFISMALFAFCSIVFAACGGTETASNGNSNTAGTEYSNKSATTSSPAAANSPASITPTSSGEKIGIPECDDYLAKYEACVSGKVPESARDQYKTSLEQMRKSWRGMAADPKTKGGLKMACQAAATQGKQTFQAYGCDF